MWNQLATIYHLQLTLHLQHKYEHVVAKIQQWIQICSLTSKDLKVRAMILQGWTCTSDKEYSNHI